jgi:thioredoxin-like negative regulator of GroEL
MHQESIKYRFELFVRNFMKIKSVLKIGLGLLAVIMALEVSAAELDLVLEEARTKAAKGDVLGAAAAYHQALKLDNSNVEARHGLADAVIQGHVMDPHAEEADVLHPIMKKNDNDEVLSSVSLPFSFLKETNQ